jgi:N-acetylneuraminic acid mutarotase
MKTKTALQGVLLSILLTLFSTGAALASNIVWQSAASMPTARYGLGVVEGLNGEILAIGGGNGEGERFDLVEAYNPTTNTWATKAPMPAANRDFGIATINNKVYVVGGYPHYTANQVYDLATNTWTVKAAMPIRRAALGAAAGPNGKLYIFGGENPGGGDISESDTVMEYDPTTNTWATKTSMPTRRHSLKAITADNGKIYAIGGFNSSMVGTVEEYDPLTDSWVTKTSMPTPRVEFGLAKFDGKIYAISGGDPEGPINSVEEYDPVTDNWTTKTGLNVARQDLATIGTSTGKLYALGGIDWNEDITFDSVEEGTFAEITNTAPTVGTISAMTSPVQINSVINTSVNFADVDASDTHTATWDWGDTTTSSGLVTESNGSGTVTGSHTYSSTGVYTVTVTVTDVANESATASYEYVVVYDAGASAGFLTGSGKYTSFTSGLAKFGVNAKYTNGNTPTGQFKWNLASTNQEFESTSYNWLVVTGDKALLKGTGTINGSGTYTFLVSAIDGSLTNSANLFRLQIKDLSNIVVYDSQPGAPDLADPTTPLSSGLIKVH